VAILDAQRECLAGELSHPGRRDLPDIESGKRDYRSEAVTGQSSSRRGRALRPEYRHLTHLSPRERGGNLPAVVSATLGAGMV